MTDRPAPLLSLLDLHELLEELFLAHQTALLDRNLPVADQWLQQFQQLLQQHIADEEAHILPRYEATVTAPEGAKPEFFRMEHQKLLRVVEELRSMLLLLEPTGHAVQFGDVLAASNPESINPRAIIDLLDREASFKDLLRHHDARERNFLYPLLAAQLSEADQQSLLSASTLTPTS